MILYPYKQESASAKALAKALGIKRIKHEGSRFQPRRRNMILNWGASVIPYDLSDAIVINPPDAVQKASNKLSAFKALSGHVPLPNWTESREDALKWLLEGHAVVARTVLNGHSGNGIVITKNPDELVEAPLYTRYVKKKEEYRVHVMRGVMFFTQRKARKLDVPDDLVNWRVRNLDGGFIYANQNVVIPLKGVEVAVYAIEKLGLDFGAVDLIHGKDDKWYVLEVNTTPGLSGTTLERYVEQLNKYK